MKAFLVLGFYFTSSQVLLNNRLIVHSFNRKVVQLVFGSFVAMGFRDS
jgi:hypothetical protein